MTDITANNTIVKDIKLLIDQAKSRIIRRANSEMTMLYWHVGKRINEEILEHKRAEYGQQVVTSLAKELSAEYGRGFTKSALIRMMQFHECFNEEQIDEEVRDK